MRLTGGRKREDALPEATIFVSIRSGRDKDFQTLSKPVVAVLFPPYMAL